MLAWFVASHRAPPVKYSSACQTLPCASVPPGPPHWIRMSTAAWAFKAKSTATASFALVLNLNTSSRPTESGRRPASIEPGAPQRHRTPSKIHKVACGRSGGAPMGDRACRQSGVPKASGDLRQDGAARILTRAAGLVVVEAIVVQVAPLAQHFQVLVFVVAGDMVEMGHG